MKKEKLRQVLYHDNILNDVFFWADKTIIPKNIISNSALPNEMPEILEGDLIRIDGYISEILNNFGLGCWIQDGWVSLPERIDEFDVTELYRKVSDNYILIWRKINENMYHKHL